MNIGDKVILTEAVMVIDALGHDLLIAGTEGIVTGIEGELLNLQTAKGKYDNIPLSCAKKSMKEKAA